LIISKGHCIKSEEDLYALLCNEIAALSSTKNEIEDTQKELQYESLLRKIDDIISEIQNSHLKKIDTYFSVNYGQL